MGKDLEKSAKLKEDGNIHFQKGDFIAAEGLYSKAIIADDTNPSLYTNRAMARFRLELYDSAISDCNEALKLNPRNAKALFILSQCQLAIRDYDAALDSGLKSHSLYAESNDKSLGPVTNQVLRCKKERWEEMEKQRAREGKELENDVISLMERERDELVESCRGDLEKRIVKEEWDRKIALLRLTFERSRAEAEKKREVPDWIIDDISFNVMQDPVMTKTGKSYERASINEHLRRNQIDPLTREPLYPHELRPNLQLKQACEEFIAKNGWAVDY